MTALSLFIPYRFVDCHCKKKVFRIVVRRIYRAGLTFSDLLRRESDEAEGRFWQEWREIASLVPVLSVDQITGCGQGELRSLQKCHGTFNRMFVKSGRIFNDGDRKPSSLQLSA
jgi:hypothetical protein